MIQFSTVITHCITRIREWGISMMRTVVIPPLAGWIAMQLLRVPWLLDLGIDSAKVQVWLTIAMTAAWYGILRWVELQSQNPKVLKWVGRLIGWASAPVARLRAGDEVPVLVEKQVSTDLTDPVGVVDAPDQGRGDDGQINNGILVTVVLVLAAIALLIWILRH